MDHPANLAARPPRSKPYRTLAAVVAVAAVAAGAWALSPDRPPRTAAPDPTGLPTAPLEATRIRFEGAPTMVAAGYGAVWVVHSDGRGGFAVAQVHPRTNRVVTDTPLETYPTDVVATPDGAYVAIDAPRRGGEIVPVGRFRGEAFRAIPLARNPGDLAIGDGSLYVGTREKVVVEVDTRTNRVVHELRGPAQSVTVVGPSVWGAAIDGRVAAMDARYHRPRDELELGWNVVRLHTGAGYVWAAQQRPDGTYALVRIDPGRGAATDTILLPDVGPGHVASGGGYLWAVQNGANGGRGSVVRIDPRTGEVVDRVRVGVSPTGIAYGAGAAWVANFGSNTVVRLDPAG